VAAGHPKEKKERENLRGGVGFGGGEELWWWWRW